MKYILMAAILVFSTCGIAQAGRQSQPPANDYDRAVQAEEMEGDVKRAMVLYGKAGANLDLSEEIRTTAHYRLGRLLRRLGHKDAAKAAFQLASEGTGAGAAKATIILRGGKPQDEIGGDLSKHIQSLIPGLFRSHGPSREALILIGEPAVKPIAEVFRLQKSQATFVVNAIRVLVEIDGPAVAAWMATVVDDEDVYFRRIVIQALVEQTKSNRREHVRRKKFMGEFRRLLADKDLKVASMALEMVHRVALPLTPQEIEFLFERTETEISRELLPALRSIGFKGALNSDPNLSKKISKSIGRLFQSQDAELVASLIDAVGVIALADAQIMDPYFTAMVAVNGAVATLPQWGIGLPRCQVLANRGKAADFLAWAEKMPKGFFLTRDQMERRQKNEFHTRSMGFMRTLEQAMKDWTSEDVPGALGLQLLGVGAWWDHKLEEFILKNHTPEQLPLLADNLMAFRNTEMICQEISARAPNMALQVSVENFLSATAEPSSTKRKWREGQVEAAIDALIHQKNQRSRDFLVKIAKTKPTVFRYVTHSLCLHDAEFAAPSLRKLLAYEGKGKEAAVGRFNAWTFLYRRAQPQDVELLVQAGRRGILSQGTIHVGENTTRTYYSYLGHSSSAFSSLRLQDRTPLGVADRLRVFEGILKGRESELSAALFRATQEGNPGSDAMWEELPSEFFQLIADKILLVDPSYRLQFTRLLSNRGLELLPQGREFVIRVLRNLGAQEKRAVLNGSPYPVEGEIELAYHELFNEKEDWLLVSVTNKVSELGLQSFVPDIRKLIANKHESVRQASLAALLRLEGSDALDAILPLAKDPIYTTRIELCKALATLGDQRVIPALIEMLRDPVERVADAAKKSLDRVQFYLEQKRIWDRLLDNSTLDASSAVAALLKQAKPGNETPVRVLAIQSLGTMAVLETLPILIEYTSSDDPEVKTAALQAVHKINNGKLKEK